MKNKTADFPYHLTKFFTEYLPLQRNLSQGSIISYRDTFRLLLIYYKSEKGIKPNHLTIEMINQGSIHEFILWLQENRSCSPSTCNQRLGAIKSFFRYLQFAFPDRALQCQENLSIQSMKTPEPGLKYLTIEGIKVLLAQPDIDTRYGRRDLALLSLMYDTGARVQEISDIRLEHIRFSAPATIRLTGKGNKTRVVPLLSRTEQILKEYIRDFKIEKQGNEAYLFQNRSGGQLSRFGISYVLTKYADIARKKHPELIPEKLSPQKRIQKVHS